MTIGSSEEKLVNPLDSWACGLYAQGDVGLPREDGDYLPFTPARRGQYTEGRTQQLSSHCSSGAFSRTRPTYQKTLRKSASQVKNSPVLPDSLRLVSHSCQSARVSLSETVWFIY